MALIRRYHNGGIRLCDADSLPNLPIQNQGAARARRSVRARAALAGGAGGAVLGRPARRTPHDELCCPGRCGRDDRRRGRPPWRVPAIAAAPLRGLPPKRSGRGPPFAGLAAPYPALKGSAEHGPNGSHQDAAIAVTKRRSTSRERDTSRPRERLRRGRSGSGMAGDRTARRGWWVVQERDAIPPAIAPGKPSGPAPGCPGHSSGRALHLDTPGQVRSQTGGSTADGMAGGMVRASGAFLLGQVTQSTSGQPEGARGRPRGVPAMFP